MKLKIETLPEMSHVKETALVTRVQRIAQTISDLAETLDIVQP